MDLKNIKEQLDELHHEIFSSNELSINKMIYILGPLHTSINRIEKTIKNQNNKRVREGDSNEEMVLGA